MNRIGCPRFALALTIVALWKVGSIPTAQAQEVRFLKQYHITIGSGVGIYPTGGGFDLSDQGFDYQGVHLDLARFGITHALSRGFRMELALELGLSALARPGYVGRTEQGEEGQSRVAFHVGFALLGYYRFAVGLTLGLGANLSIGAGEFLDTSFFRALPAIGWEFGDGLGEWFVHLRWVTGLTLLHGLSEYNTAPASNLSWSGIQVVYGF